MSPCMTGLKEKRKEDALLKNKKNTNKRAHDLDISDDELDLIGGGASLVEKEADDQSNESSDDELDDISQGASTNDSKNLKNDCNKPNKFHQFKSNHPQYWTHVVTYTEDDPKIVPHFIGGTLPRSDQGDHEYYCSTMLAIFKPWHNGYDLKAKNETWDDAFRQHEFSKRDQIYMKNFNLRYECNDARDDYSAKLKKNKKNILTGSWATDESLNHLDASADQYEDYAELEAAYEEALLCIDLKSSYF